MFKKILCFLIFAMLSAVSQATARESPVATVEKFLTFYFNVYKFGVPTDSDLQILDPIVTERFNKLLKAARRAEDCHYREVNNSEPPLHEGDLFSSAADGATSAKLAKPRIKGNTAVVTVLWTAVDPRGKWPDTHWQDSVLLLSAGNKWLIDDFHHSGTWGFMSKGNVSALLLAISDVCQH